MIYTWRNLPTNHTTTTRVITTHLMCTCNLWGRSHELRMQGTGWWLGTENASIFGLADRRHACALVQYTFMTNTRHNNGRCRTFPVSHIPAAQRSTFPPNVNTVNDKYFFLVIRLREEYHTNHFIVKTLWRKLEFPFEDVIVVEIINYIEVHNVGWSSLYLSLDCRSTRKVHNSMFKGK